MKKNAPCKREPEVIAALHSGKLSEELSVHMKKCRDCRISATLFGQFPRFKEESFEREVSAREMPDPDDLWRRARIFPVVSPDRNARILRPLRLWRRLAPLVTAVGSGFVLLSHTGQIRKLLQHFDWQQSSGGKMVQIFLEYMKSSFWAAAPIILFIAFALIVLFAWLFSRDDSRHSKKYPKMT